MSQRCITQREAAVPRSRTFRNIKKLNPREKKLFLVRIPSKKHTLAVTHAPHISLRSTPRRGSPRCHPRLIAHGFLVVLATACFRFDLGSLNIRCDTVDAAATFNLDCTAGNVVRSRNRIVP